MDLTTLIIIIPFFFFLLLPTKVASASCSITKCGDSSTPNIRFPFRVKDSDSCGQPGFEVFCSDTKQTLIELPSSGSFTIKSIDYAAQEIWVNDPNNCLPKRLLTFNLSLSPFSWVYSQYFSFFNCSKALLVNPSPLQQLVLIGPIKCLSGPDHFVYATTSTNNSTHFNQTTTLCTPMTSGPIRVPVQWPLMLHNSTIESELSDDLRLSWFMPECRPCEVKGQMCGVETNSSGSQVILCSNIPNQGREKLPLATYIGVIVVICAPSIICLVGSVYIWIKACYKATEQNRALANTLEDTTVPHHHMVELGLEEAGVEFARQVVRLGLSEETGPEFLPTIVLSEIEELGPVRGEDNTCAICMGEYRRKDKIGTLPSCGHYFHGDCINKWLLTRSLIERTCPICRAPVGS